MCDVRYASCSFKRVNALRCRASTVMSSLSASIPAPNKPVAASSDNKFENVKVLYDCLASFELKTISHLNVHLLHHHMQPFRAHVVCLRLADTSVRASGGCCR